MNLVKRQYRTVPSRSSLFNDFFYNSFPKWDNTASVSRCNSRPASNITEGEEGFEIELVAPGLKREDLTINLEDGRLTISSDLNENNAEGEGSNNFLLHEFDYRSFSRSFIISEDVIDSSGIEAKMANGVLTISLPKKEEAKPKPPKQIEIS